MPAEVGVVVQSSPASRDAYQAIWPQELQPYDPTEFISAICRLWMLVFSKIVL